MAADSEDEEDDDDENLDEDPTIEHLNVDHYGGVNRIRAMPQKPGLVASMAETSHVHIYDLSASLQSMTTKGPRSSAPRGPMFTFSGHKEEGFAIDWSPTVAGRLATGDCSGKIHVLNPHSAGVTWESDGKGFSGHAGSVEDLQWSPSENTVFASCSADKTIRIWDTRDKSKSQISFQAHDEDINVISWNRKLGYLLASGCDDGTFKVR